MSAEQILKREDGSRVKIRVVVMDMTRSISYAVSVSYCEPGKRKFHSATDSNNYQYRRLNSDDREKARLENALKYCTQEEINAVCVQCWENMKPSEENTIMSVI